jgi:hypothetical protein
MSAPPIPQPEDADDKARVKHSAIRHRMLIGEWKQDLIDELRQFFAPEVLVRITHPDVSRCVAASAWRQLNVGYNDSPTVTIDPDGDPDNEPADDDQPDLRPIITPRLWPMRQQGNLITIGLNESLMRLDWNAERKELTGYGIDYRPVWPDFVTAKAHPDMPDTPVRVEELRLRYRPGTEECEWTWEVWDVELRQSPIFRIDALRKSSDGQSLVRVDATAEYMPVDWDGSYPYVDKAGDPVLPYELYHEHMSDRLWNERDGSEVVEATLKVGVLHTFWLHGVRDAAHPQRYGVDVEIPSARNLGPDGREVDSVTLDQTAILLFKSRNGQGGTLGTLDPAMDVEATLAAITDYARAALTDAGLRIRDGEMSRVSGYALVVDSEQLRQAQRRQIPARRLGDQRLLAKAAKLVNKYEGWSLPERPEAYQISYHGIPKSLEEVRSDVERINILRGIGLISDVDALLELHPEWTPDQAKRKLIEIRQQAHPAIEGPAGEMPDPSSGASPSGGRAGAVPEPVEMPEIEDAVEVEPAEPSGEAPPPATAEAPKAQDTALNGAQVTSLLDVIDRVARKQLPRESAVAILVRAFSVASEDAEAMLGTVGKSFFTDEPAPQVAPSSTPPPKPPSQPDDEPAPQDAP